MTNAPARTGRPVKASESANIVARARAVLGISQKAMAMELGGVSRASVAHWEAERYPVPGPVQLLCQQILEKQENTP